MENQVNLEVKLDANNDIVAVEIDQLACFVRPKGNGFLASCECLKSLGFSTESKEAAVEDLKKAINVFFKVHVEAGTLFDALERFGFEGSRKMANNNLIGNQNTDKVRNNLMHTSSSTNNNVLNPFNAYACYAH